MKSGRRLPRGRRLLSGRWLSTENRTDLIVLLIYAGVAAGMTWPLAARIATHLPGATTDTLVHYWNGWWVRQALASRQTPFHTSLLFYPRGISLAFHNFAWLNIAAWLLLRPLVGGFVAYNVPLLVNLALCGFAAFLLARDLTNDARAAFLGGLIYQCWPFRLHQLDHPNLISTQWIPLFLLFLVRAVRRQRWQDAVLAATFLALTGYTRWQLLIPAAILGGIYGLCSLATRTESRRRVALALSLVAAVAVLALLPAAVVLAGEWRTASADLLVAEDEVALQTDLLAYVTPSSSHPVLGPLARPAYDRYYADRSGGRRFPAYVGATALLLALLGAGTAGRKSLPWVFMSLVLVLLALGPVLRVGGRLYPSAPMPYRLASRLPFVRLLRFPDRFNMFLALPVAVLAAYGCRAVLANARHARWLAPGILSLLTGVVLFEYLAVPVPLQRTQLSPYYAELAAEPGDFAILNLPLGPQQSKHYMFAQTFHQRPILQGKTARFPEGTYDYLDAHLWLRSLRYSGEMSPSATDLGRQLGSLAEDGVRYVALHKALLDAGRLARWQRQLLTNPSYEDGQLAVYSTAPQAGRDFVLAHELASGIGVVEAITSTGCQNPNRVLEVDVGWGTTEAPGRELRARLALVADEGSAHQEETFPLSPNWPIREWPANAVGWGYYALCVDPSLPPGTYDVTLSLVDPQVGAIQGQTAVLDRVTVSDVPCTFEVPADVVGVNALFGDELRLLGYRLEQAGDQLTLALHWRSERRMETAYKVFVHVFDPATPLPVVQDDAMPRRWTYPTTLWGPGEVVVDSIPISLMGVAPGTYGIAVGVYDPATMERLPAVSESSERQRDDRLVLSGAMIEVEEFSP